MKKIFLGLCLAIFISGLIYASKRSGEPILEVKKPNEDIIPLMLNETIATSEVKRPGMSHDLRSLAKKQSRIAPKNELTEYPKSLMNFFDRPYFLIEGVYASFRKVPDQKLIASMGGFFIYESQVKDSYPIVFSSDKNAYGYFTGEIIVTGPFEKTLELIQSKSFDVLYENDVTEQIIFKVDHINDLSTIEELKSLPGVNVEPDLKFSRLGPI